MTSTPETPESKPKGGFMGLLGQVKSAVSKAVPGNISIEDIKNKVKAQADSVSSSVNENLKKVDMNKMTDKIKGSLKSDDKNKPK